MRKALWVIAVLLAFALSAWAEDVKIRWDQNLDSPDGYAVYYKVVGTADYTSLDMSNPAPDAQGFLNFTIPGLVQGQYEIRITAYTGTFATKTAESKMTYAILYDVWLQTPTELHAPPE